MSNRVERLRGWLLGSAVFLLLVIFAFIGTARYLRRHYLSGIPVQLALNILRETANWKYCQTEGGTTRFCMHAAKSIEYDDGKMKLHDVTITLYGKKGDRSDRIYGDEFEYDKNAEVMRATGLVHIDLQAAGAAAGLAHGGATGMPQPGADAKVMHVTTSGLMYLKKLGVASTSEPIEFEAGGLKGHAVGADYSSDSAIMMLHSAVTMSGIEDGRPLTMTAATAEFDDRSQQALLTRATYESEGRKATAEQATLYRRLDGTLSRIDAKGNVTVEKQGSTVVAQHADVALTAASQPQTAVLTGGVRYSVAQPVRQVSGQADDATVRFDGQAKPQPEHAVFTGAVHVMERTRATTAAKEPWSTRELKAERVEIALTPTDAGTARVRDVTATGSPHLTVVNNGSLASSRGEGTTELSADNLSTHLTDVDDAKTAQVDTIAGRGNTLLRQRTPDGKEQTVAADSLDAKLRPMAAGTGAKSGAAAGAGDQVAQSLLSSVQVGHVQMMRRAPGKAKAGAAAGGTVADTIEHALADRAVYDGDANRMTLSGGVQLSDADSMVWANQVALDHATGDAHATGAVKVSYTEDEPAGSAHVQDEPAHVLADRADLVHATDTATFYGKPVRLWQGGNQILAPVIELSNTQRRLVARGDGTTGASGAQVQTVLSASAKDGAGAKGEASGCPVAATAKAGAPGSAGSAARTASAVRVASGELTFSEETRQADFTGGFRADTADGTIRSAEGIVFLKQAVAAPGTDGTNARRPTAVAAISGDLDHLVATGRVELDKPGLKATGERLVYTASDRTAVLTGDAKDPPKAVEADGTTTGNALRLRAGCDGGGSVEVLGAPGQRVHTDARVSDEGKKEKGKR
jgi:lipopolysaccharide export system protein LptA